MPEDETKNVPAEAEQPKKKERPQNKNLRRFDQMSPEERLAMQRKGAAASQRRKAENKALQRLMQAALKCKMDEAIVNKILQAVKMPQDSNGKTKVENVIVGKNLELAMGGDAEARNWIFAHAYPDEFEAYKRQSAASVGASSGTPVETVQIHLIRGMKPTDEEDGEDGR